MATATATTPTAPRVKAKRISIVLATGSYQREAPTTVLRLVEKLLQRGVDVNVWAFEEAVTLTNKDQIDHNEPGSLQKVLGEKHPNIGRFIDQLLRAGLHGAKLDWVSCILCVQERGVEKHQMGGAIVGTLGDLWKFVKAADKVICIPTYR
ncbi:MAG: DsrE family protein [Candidatus Manganitrophaceae bacterium]